MTAWTAWFDVRTLGLLALAVLALLALLLGLALARNVWRAQRMQDHVDRALNRGAMPDLAGVNNIPGSAAVQGDGALAAILERAAVLGTRWGDGRFGDVLLEEEDRRLLDMSAYASYSTARALFLFARGTLSMSLPGLAVLLLPSGALGASWLSWVLYGILGFGLGWMLPKWVVQRRYRKRRLAVIDELPLLVDLLRLLQGVGLSMDQSLHVIETEFPDVLPVLAHEIGLSVEHYRRGRPRLQSMGRMINGFDNEDLEMICRLIAQVDEHGGAVQDPLTRFSERLREQRRMALKEKIGKLTVKMTGVMVVTLLPALLIVTAGSGFIAVLRGLTQVGGG